MKDDDQKFNNDFCFTNLHIWASLKEEEDSLGVPFNELSTIH